MDLRSPIDIHTARLTCRQAVINAVSGYKTTAVSQSSLDLRHFELRSVYTLFHSIATLLATATDCQLRRYIEFLKAENEILRARLPAEIHTRPAERERLLKFGLPLGKAIEELITMVSPSTCYRWRRETSRGKARKPKPRGKSQVLRDLVIQLATSPVQSFPPSRGRTLCAPRKVLTSD